jgi:phage/conjugal plasmid C-4 type zinc finger TraR family protein
MDEADLAQQTTEKHLASAIKAHTNRNNSGVTLLECEDCGEPIPEARRQAVPGCTRCVECQTAYEARK